MNNQNSNVNGNSSDARTNNTQKKRKHTQLEKDIIKLHFLSNLKLKKLYNCTKKSYEKIIVGYLLNNAGCNLVTTFKENMLTDYIDEFFRREYKLSESNERVPKFAIYYKNYLKFFCQPTFSDFKINELINEYGERRAELYYKNNYQGGKTSENDDYGFEESDSEEQTEKDDMLNFNEKGDLFNDEIKENIDNVTIMTTISSSNNTINLKLINEKIEVFSENKCDKSNDTTFHEILELVKKGKVIKVNENKKSDSNLKSSLKNSQNGDMLNSKNHDNCNSNDNNISSHNFTNINHVKKWNKVNKAKNDILNIINFKKAMLSKGCNIKHQNKRKEGNKSIKKQSDKINFPSKEKKKISAEKLHQLLKKSGIICLNKKYPSNPKKNYINIILQKKTNKSNKIKLTANSNWKILQEKENRFIDREQNKNENNNFKKRKSNSHSLNLHLKNRSKSKEKEASKKLITNKVKNTNNDFYSIKNSYGNLTNNLFQNNFLKNNNNNHNAYINIYTTNKNNPKSRNSNGFFNKQQANTNNTINNNIMYNLNNIYNTTSLHKLYKRSSNNKLNNMIGNNGKLNLFKTLNFLQARNNQQRYNNLFLTNNGKKYQLSNTSQENRSSSLKVLHTDLNNTNNVKPTIKLQHKFKYITKHNFDNNFIENRKPHQRITKSYNNLNNIHISNNGINSYNNLKNKNNNKFNNNKLMIGNLKNIKNNQKTSNVSNINKKIDTNNKELMRLALSLFIDNNNESFGNVGLNSHNHNNSNNKKNNINKNNNKKISLKKNKINFKNNNKYHNNNTNYNININNQININTGFNTNNFKKGRDYLNTKIRNQDLNNNKNHYFNNCNYYGNSINSGFFGISNNKHNSENINLNKKNKLKNISIGLKKWNLLCKKNNGKTKENIIKSYHTKSLSSLTDLAENKNKKGEGFYRNISTSKTKEHRKIGQ